MLGTLLFSIYFRSENDDEMEQTGSDDKVRVIDLRVHPHNFDYGFLGSTSQQSGEGDHSNIHMNSSASIVGFR